MFFRIMPHKRVSMGSSKRPRLEAPTLGTYYTLVFNTQVHQDLYARLSRRFFGESREIDWNVLREVGLEMEV